MNKNKLSIVNEILKSFIRKNDENKDWIYSIKQSEEWLKLTYEAFLEFESDLNLLFSIQKSRLLDSLEDLGENITHEILNIYIENIEKQQVLYEQILYKHFMSILNLIKSEVLSQVGESSIEVSFDLLNEKAFKFLEEKKIKFAIKVADTTHKSIIRELSEGFKLGEGIPELSNRIKNMPEFSMKRATVVARTEVISSSNAGTLEGYKESGVVIGKEWDSHEDERTRKHHLEANGQRVKLDESFIIDGDLLDYPGDNSHDAKASNVIQCRCTLKPILEGEVI
ncbi:NAD()--arginine ADP-ribosyltransferase EFV [[Clostridium] sordellii]|uniref:NAD( )--arginine ADP-ribosyltransferase EFV n=1 Tax=Paraclostridium sordellii TaxID=1505 RepID=A0A0C7R7R0_PARSO|nr:phage minor head protein [Paeniclostridium sordellii]CEQ04094.1 NAD()--arginine ADP-ribosyltransferase EFV [[Clostridium] sordellii] [Paeniclostridium sordellii]